MLSYAKNTFEWIPSITILDLRDRTLSLLSSSPLLGSSYCECLRKRAWTMGALESFFSLGYAPTLCPASGCPGACPENVWGLLCVLLPGYWSQVPEGQLASRTAVGPMRHFFPWILRMGGKDNVNRLVPSTLQRHTGGVLDTEGVPRVVDTGVVTFTRTSLYMCQSSDCGAEAASAQGFHSPESPQEPQPADNL